MNLQEILTTCENNSLKGEKKRDLINLCHSMALAYLRMKASSEKLYMIRGERLEDLAWDFIADLFEQNRDGEMVKINEYFSELDLKECSHSDLKIELRKIVFTKVDDNIFRAIGKKDPSLRKIIRNLKLAIGESEDSNIFYEQGFLIVGGFSEKHLPVMPSEFMQIKLCSRLNEKMQIPDILHEVLEILKEQDQYQSKFSVVALSIIIRESFVYLHDYLTDSSGLLTIDQHFFSNEFETFLVKCATTVKTRTGYRYVEKGKIPEEELDLYMKAAISIVKDQFTKGKKKFSQYEHLKQYITDIDYQDFRENKRQFLEYLVAQIKEKLIDIYRADWLNN